MLQHVLDLLPDAATQTPAFLALGIAIGGAVVALVGARFSRAIITLAFVAIGTVVGLHMPAWFGWGIDRIGTAFGAAVLFGFAAFVLPKFWERAILGGLLALFAGVGVWLTMSAGAPWAWPSIDWTANAPDIARTIWQSIPVVVSRSLPIGVVVGFALGALVGSLLPRLGRVMLYGLGGMSAAVVFGTLHLQQRRPQWIDSIPPNAVTQAMIFSGLVLAAMGVQWFLLPRRAAIKPKHPPARSGNKVSSNDARFVEGALTPRG